MLDVQVPPDITQSSSDQELREGETAHLECRSDGYPKPKISWRREDNEPIKVMRGTVVQKCKESIAEILLLRYKFGVLCGILWFYFCKVSSYIEMILVLQSIMENRKLSRGLTKSYASGPQHLNYY